MIQVGEVVSMMKGDEDAIPSKAGGQGRGEYMIRLVFKEFAVVNLVILSPSRCLLKADYGCPLLSNLRTLHLLISPLPIIISALKSLPDPSFNITPSLQCLSDQSFSFTLPCLKLWRHAATVGPPAVIMYVQMIHNVLPSRVCCGHALSLLCPCVNLQYCNQLLARNLPLIYASTYGNRGNDAERARPFQHDSEMRLCTK